MNTMTSVGKRKQIRFVPTSKILDSYKNSLRVLPPYYSNLCNVLHHWVSFTRLVMKNTKLHHAYGPVDKPWVHFKFSMLLSFFFFFFFVGTHFFLSLFSLLRLSPTNSFKFCYLWCFLYAHWSSDFIFRDFFLSSHSPAAICRQFLVWRFKLCPTAAPSASCLDFEVLSAWINSKDFL
jgi:hypothetical protein